MSAAAVAQPVATGPKNPTPTPAKAAAKPAAAKPAAKARAPCCCASKVVVPKTAVNTTAAPAAAAASAPAEHKTEQPVVSHWDSKKAVINIPNKTALEQECRAELNKLIPSLKEDIDATKTFIATQSRIFKDEHSTDEQKLRAACMLSELQKASATW
jgi:hypothetical protein